MCFRKNICEEHFEFIMRARSIVNIASLASCVRIENNHTTLLQIKSKFIVDTYIIQDKNIGTII